MSSSQSNIRRIGFWCVVIFVISVLGFGAAYEYWIVFDYRFFPVTDGKVYRSGAMPIEKLEKRIRNHGIRTIIDLRKPDEQKEIDAEHQAASLLGVTHINLPSEQEPSDETVNAFLEIMKNEDTRPVLIHCHHGEGRAVLFSAIYRIEFEGWTNEDARRASRLITWKSSFDADRDKGIYLKKYVPRLNTSKSKDE